MILIFSIIFAIGAYWSMLEGEREALYYDAVQRANIPIPELHSFWMRQRICVFSIIAIILFLSIDWVSLLFDLSLILIFPYFHDGQYYVVRNRLDQNVYKKGWFDSSTTSTAKNEFGLFERSIMAFIGISIYTLFLFIIAR